jgi:hypothetical protein
LRVKRTGFVKASRVEGREFANERGHFHLDAIFMDELTRGRNAEKGIPLAAARSAAFGDLVKAFGGEP